jgi:putative DNA binding domain, excisionase family protein
MAASGRFLTLKQVADELSSSVQQVRSLIKNGDIKAIRIGENGSYRIERHVFESYINKQYETEPDVPEDDSIKEQESDDVE